MVRVGQMTAILLFNEEPYGLDIGEGARKRLRRGGQSARIRREQIGSLLPF